MTASTDTDLSQTTVLGIGGMTCAACVRRVERRLRKLRRTGTPKRVL